MTSESPWFQFRCEILIKLLLLSKPQFPIIRTEIIISHNDSKWFSKIMYMVSQNAWHIVGAKELLLVCIPMFLSFFQKPSLEVILSYWTNRCVHNTFDFDTSIFTIIFILIFFLEYQWKKCKECTNVLQVFRVCLTIIFILNM